MSTDAVTLRFLLYRTDPVAKVTEPWGEPYDRLADAANAATLLNELYKGTYTFTWQREGEPAPVYQEPAPVYQEPAPAPSLALITFQAPSMSYGLLSADGSTISTVCPRCACAYRLAVRHNQEGG